MFCIKVNGNQYKTFSALCKINAVIYESLNKLVYFIHLIRTSPNCERRCGRYRNNKDYSEITPGPDTKGTAIY